MASESFGLDVSRSCSDSEESRVLDSAAFSAARRRAVSGGVVGPSTLLYQFKI
jgi:hypothetical protein